MSKAKPPFPPAHASSYIDRHGKTRWRWRATGYDTKHFKCNDPALPDWWAEYAAFEAQETTYAREVRERIVIGSVNDLCVKYYRSLRFQRLAPVTQSTYRNLIERFREVHGRKSVAGMNATRLDAYLMTLAATPATANGMRKVLKILGAYAVKIGMRETNPAEETDRFASGPGYHTWTDNEIAQYRTHHAMGTMARLSLELILNTATRKCNAVELKRVDYRDGCFHVKHAKGGDETIVRALPETVEAISSMPVTGVTHFIVTAHGKPFTAAGFGNKFRDWCNQAALPHCTAHGLRKAISRQLAESGVNSLQGRAVTGHVKDETFAYYAAKANRKLMADAALDKLANHKTSSVGEPSAKAHK